MSNAETAKRLAIGDEFIDLEQLENGVRTAPVKGVPTSRMLPRKAVHQRTWNKILLVLAGMTVAPEPDPEVEAAEASGALVGGADHAGMGRGHAPKSS